MTNLSHELAALACVAVFTSILWIPIILNRISEMGLLTALKNPQPDVRPKSDWAYRLASAHRNAIENLVVFAPLALIVHAQGLESHLTSVAAGVFLVSRIAHAVIYTLGIPFFRTVAFAICFGCEIIFALRIFGLV